MERARPDRRLTDLADLTDLLASVAEQQRLGRSQRDEADYWASQIRPALDIDDAQTIAWLLLDIAEHPLVPDRLCQRARAWATALERLGPRADRSAQGGRAWTSCQTTSPGTNSARRRRSTWYSTPGRPPDCALGNRESARRGRQPLGRYRC